MGGWGGYWEGCWGKDVGHGGAEGMCASPQCTVGGLSEDRERR